MPRGPRLDAPGTLHHVMVRGIEGRPIFRDDRDRDDFVGRLAAQAQAGGLIVYAWALLPNHAHLLVRTGRVPLARGMRSLLTGYAGAFNRRHRRRGHLFQNRYRSIVVEEEPYLLALTRYIHLNPLRAGVVPDLGALERYPWGGHSALLGHVPRPWHALDDVLGQFAGTRREARRRYRAFVADGVSQGRQPDLIGGGLRRSAGGWETLATLQRGRERWAFDERVLGSGAFVERVLKEAAPPPGGIAVAGRSLPALIAQIAAACGVHPAEIQSGSRRRPAARARAAVAAVAVTRLGLSAARVAKALGVSAVAIFQAIDRGLAELRTRGLDPDRLAKGIIRQVK